MNNKKLGEIPSAQERPGQPHNWLPQGDAIFINPPVKADLPQGEDWRRDLGDEMLQKLLFGLAQFPLMIKQPPYIEAPFNHVLVDIMETVTVLAGATSNILSYTVPVKQTGAIVEYGQDISLLVPGIPDWTKIKWFFRVNNAPLQFFNGFTGQRGTIYWPRKCTIYLKTGQTITIAAQNTDVLPYNITAAVRGWQYFNL
jgi:hypothetical protein